MPSRSSKKFSTPDQLPMLSFQVIGCSSGVPHPRLACSSYLLRHNSRYILFDCGEGASSAMCRLKIDPRKIESVFLSHMHPDHCMGLPLFVQANYVLKRTTRLDIFVPSEAVKGVRSLLDMTYLYPLKLAFDLEVHRFDPDSKFEMTNLAVTASQNTHLSRHSEMIKSARKKNRMQSFTYHILADDKKIVYSGDLGSENDLINNSDNCDLLVVERSHIDLVKFGQMLRSRHVKLLLVTHLNEGFDPKETRRLLNVGASTRLRFAREGLSINLS